MNKSILITSIIALGFASTTMAETSANVDGNNQQNMRHNMAKDTQGRHHNGKGMNRGHMVNSPVCTENSADKQMKTSVFVQKLEAKGYQVQRLSYNHNNCISVQAMTKEGEYIRGWYDTATGEIVPNTKSTGKPAQ